MCLWKSEFVALVNLFRYKIESFSFHKVIFCRATAQGNLQIISLMLKHGYKFINAKNEKGMTCAHIAAEDPNISIDVLKIFQNYEAKLDEIDLEVNRPLHVSKNDYTAS